MSFKKKILHLCASVFSDGHYGALKAVDGRLNGVLGWRELSTPWLWRGENGPYKRKWLTDKGIHWHKWNWLKYWWCLNLLGKTQRKGSSEKEERAWWWSAFPAKAGERLPELAGLIPFLKENAPHPTASGSKGTLMLLGRNRWRACYSAKNNPPS